MFHVKRSCQRPGRRGACAHARQSQPARLASCPGSATPRPSDSGCELGQLGGQLRRKPADRVECNAIAARPPPPAGMPGCLPPAAAGSRHSGPRSAIGSMRAVAASRSQGNAAASGSRPTSGWPSSSNTDRQRPSARTAMPCRAKLAGMAALRPRPLPGPAHEPPDAREMPPRVRRRHSPTPCPFPVSRRSALSARSVRRNSAREVNIR